MSYPPTTRSKSESVGFVLGFWLLRLPLQVLGVAWRTLKKFPDLFLAALTFLLLGLNVAVPGFDTPSNLVGLAVGYTLAMWVGVRMRRRRALLATQAAAEQVLADNPAWSHETPRVRVTSPASFQKSTQTAFGGEIR
ncbi:hypothetical protein nbrc107696_42660 [Gordonia spumicola]|uniref:Uncharacterized protein n=1 Tax=Gordonia spumicola TaxID=589161 RepID=A0A7I9VFM5_9ACTN|nr:hypothetical protein nbrc107696_42660 [Gordonia spumicola]